MVFEHEIIVPGENLPFQVFTFEGKNGDYLRGKHWHSDLEIFALFSGELEFYIDDRKYILEPGKFIILNSNEVHSIVAQKPNDAVVLQFPVSVLNNYCSEDDYIFFYHEPNNSDDELMKLLEKTNQVCKEKNRGYHLEALALFYSVMYLLVSKYQKFEIAGDQLKRNKNLKKLSTIITYIKEHYAEELTLENVADHFNYSPTYLSKMFRTYAGITFKNYVEDIRLYYAVNEIRAGKASLGEVALKYGFANSRVLARVFEKNFGMLPSDYRKKYTQKDICPSNSISISNHDQ